MLRQNGLGPRRTPECWLRLPRLRKGETCELAEKGSTPLAMWICVWRAQPCVSQQQVEQMEPKEFEVEVVARHRAMYRVRAANREAAEDLASTRWKRGEPSDIDGYEWSELESVEALEVAEPARLEEDAELVLRFLRERERLIVRLSGGEFGASGNDAISAIQVASDLGWGRRESHGAAKPDVGRAVQALEHLCASRQLVSFERPRVRLGERGDIRLYCTPEYLERLTASLKGLSRQAV